MYKDWFTGYEYSVTCQDTVPPALICALEASIYEGAIRKLVSIGRDTDTICAIGGAVAEVLFSIPPEPKAKGTSYNSWVMVILLVLPFPLGTVSLSLRHFLQQ